MDMPFRHALEVSDLDSEQRCADSTWFPTVAGYRQWGIGRGSAEYKIAFAGADSAKDRQFATHARRRSESPSLDDHGQRCGSAPGVSMCSCTMLMHSGSIWMLWSGNTPNAESGDSTSWG